MSVDYSLHRIPSSHRSETWHELLAFGSQQEIIDRLCAVAGFKHDARKDELYLRLREKFSPNPVPLEHPQTARTTIYYIYDHKNDEGRSVEYALQGDPVVCISINRAYPEDLLPVIEVLSDLSPFEILGPQGFTDPKSLFYPLDEWIQKNYEEGEPLNDYTSIESIWREDV